MSGYTPSHPVAQFLQRLAWFLDNRQISGAFAGTRRSALSPAKENYHSLGLKKVAIHGGIPPLPGYPQAIISAPREAEVGAVLSSFVPIRLINNNVTSDSGLLEMLDLSWRVRDELARYWEEVGGPVKLADGARPFESDYFMAPGGTFEGQPMPPIQGLTLNIPVRLLPAR